MRPLSARPSTSRTGVSQRPESILQRVSSARPPSQRSSRRGFVPLASATTTQRHSSHRRTPSGTPAPIQSRIAPQSPTQSGMHDDDDSLDHIIVALDKTSRNTVGCSYYVARDGVLYCMEDITNAEDGVFETLKMDLQPTVVLVSPRVDMSEQELGALSGLDLSDSDVPTLPYKTELRPSNDFKPESAFEKLAAIPSLDLPSVRFLVPGEDEVDDSLLLAHEPGRTALKGQALRTSANICYDCVVSIGCAGAIVNYLQKRKASEYLHGDPAADEAYQILKFDVFSFRDTMLVNQDTLTSLQILQPESHPNTANQGPGSSGSKESLSVYGLFLHFAKTPQGRQRLRNMFVRPSTELDTIRKRHDSVAVLSNSTNQETRQALSKSLAKIKRMPRVMLMLHKGVKQNTKSFKSTAWSSLLDFCYYVIEIYQLLPQLSGFEHIDFWRRWRSTVEMNEFKRLGKALFETIDLEETAEQHRTVIKRDIDPALDQIKDTYDHMDDMLVQVAIASMQDVPPSDPAPNLIVTYIPNIGFLVSMPCDQAEDLMAIGFSPDWERMFWTEKGAYFKNNRMRDLDNTIGDLWTIICDREIEIAHDLAQRVLESEKLILDTSDLCGELDTLLALAHGAAEYKLVRPRMTHENVIDIRGGRHLIQELVVPAYISNDTFVVGGDDSGHTGPETVQVQENPNLLLITGPNYSGKSVYLKQVALIAYMAQVGSFVSADYARLGITDRILTRITTRETISKGQSTFMIDLQQMAYALNTFTARSLLIIDEFGKGTDSCDGAALCAGVLSYLLSLGNTAPKVLASTHFHEIFEQDLMKEDAPGLGLRQMEVIVAPRNQAQSFSRGQNQQHHNTEVTYLYNVRPGRSTLSYGAQCAAMNGVPEVIVNRASELNERALAGENMVALCSVASAEEADDLRDAEEVCKAFMALDLDEISKDENLSARIFEMLDDCLGSSTAGSEMSSYMYATTSDSSGSLSSAISVSK